MKKLFFSVFAFAICCNLHAQEINTGLPEVAPVSPETASLLRYKEVPVSHYTGTANIDVPIYSLKGRDISVPISASYHTGGHRVSEIASWIGLGWSLNVGGQVTRVVKGLPDDDPKGYIRTEHTVNTFSDPSDIRRARDNERDYEPDEFHFSFMGYSGKFSFNQERDASNTYGKIIQMPHQDVKIEFTFNNDEISEWKITTNDGTKFYFGTGNAYEKNIFTESWVGNLAKNKLEFPSRESTNYITAWKLKQIESSNGDVVTFSYDNYTYYNCSYGGESQIIQFSFVGGGAAPHTETYMYSESTNSKIREITSVNGKVVFNTGINRQDKLDSPLLDNIQVFNKDSNLIKTINFKTDYFISEYSTDENFRFACGGSTPSTDELIRRLKLNEIEFIGNYNTTDLNSKYNYTFDYNTENTLPHRFSFATDYWGYYNGHKENEGAVPSMKVDGAIEQPAINWVSYFQTENKRNVEPLYAKANILTKITYPEGGSSKLFYENNAAIIKKESFEGQTNIIQPSDEKKITITNFSNYLHDVSYVSEHNTNKYRYRIPFSISNLIQYYGRVEYNSTTNICELEEDSLPLDDGSCDLKFNIYKLDQNGQIDNGFQFSRYINRSGAMNFSAGNYILELEIISTAYDTTNFDQSAIVNLSWFEQGEEAVNGIDINSETHQLFYTGGVRVKEIKEYDYLPLEAKTKFLKSRAYTYSQDSARFANLPVYYEFVEISEWVQLHSNALGNPHIRQETTVPRIKSNPVYPVLTTKGSSVGYTKVIETITDVGLVGAKKVNEYAYSYQKSLSFYKGAPVNKDWLSGKLKESILNKTEKSYIKKQINYFEAPNFLSADPNNYVEGREVGKYYYIEVPIFDSTPPPSINLVQFKNLENPPYLLNGGSIVTKGETSETKHSEGKITTEQQEFKYEVNQLTPTEIKKTVDDDVFLTKVFYPINASNLPGIDILGINKLLIKNKKSVPIQVESYKNGLHLTTQRSNYGSPPSSGEIVVPLTVESSKESTISLKEVVVYHDYTPFGQAREVSKKDGTHIYYIWGYNYTYPIAKIENATKNEVIAIVDEAAIQQYNDTQLNSVFTNLRDNLPNAQVTTYLWKSLIGVTEITNPRAEKQTFKYDAFGRLQYVLDKEENVLKENKYNYHNQN